MDFYKKKYSSKLKNRKAVSEVITTVMLLAITVVGGVFVATWASDNDITDMGVSTNPIAGSSGSATSSIILIGYDVRDGVGLSALKAPITGAGSLDNFFDNKLCTKSCEDDLTQNKRPTATEGTEFIVLKIRNTGFEAVTIMSVVINGVDHSWDLATAGKMLDLTNDIPSPSNGFYPESGKFSIIPSDNPLPATPGLQQDTDAKIAAGEQFRIIVKLNDLVGAGSDLDVNVPLRILINTDRLDTTPFLLTTGTTR